MKSTLKNWQGTAAVIGVDWGDSGKGRLVDDLSQNAHIVSRYNGGSNTGHTVQNKFGKFALHITPSGIFNQKAKCVIGRGVAVDLESLVDDEFNQLKKAHLSWRNLLIDEQATLTMPWHKLRDGLREKYRKSKIGTTGRGVGPTYADRVERVGIRLKDLFSKNFKKILKEEIDFQNEFFSLNLSFGKIFSKYQRYAKVIKSLVCPTIPLVRKSVKEGKNVLFEGAQGWLLDIDSGTYPFVTSSNPGVVGIWRSFDLHPSEINHVIGITKAYMTRVGNGPMPTKIEGQIKNLIIDRGREIGTTSGRVRDPGWLDLVAVKAACNVNKVNSLAITKLDIFTYFKSLNVCVDYKIGGKSAQYQSGDADYLLSCQPVYETLPGWQENISQVSDFKNLPKNAQNFIKKVENFVKVPVNFIGVGPNRKEAIYV